MMDWSLPWHSQGETLRGRLFSGLSWLGSVYNYSETSCRISLTYLLFGILMRTVNARWKAYWTRSRMQPEVWQCKFNSYRRTNPTISTMPFRSLLKIAPTRSFCYRARCCLANTSEFWHLWQTTDCRRFIKRGSLRTPEVSCPTAQT